MMRENKASWERMRQVPAGRQKYLSSASCWKNGPLRQKDCQMFFAPDVGRSIIILPPVHRATGMDSPSVTGISQ